MADSQVLPSSFRDPSGFLFTRANVLYRQVNEVHREHYDLLHSSGLYGRLTEAGLLVRHEEVDVEPDVPGGYKVIRPDLVDLISYPYEWCFAQLRDAALTTLRIQTLAMEKGMSLRDATAYNIQFQRGRPVLIDTLSFERLEEGKPWIAYRQFCQHFLAPLALMSYRDVRLAQLFRAHIDGVPLDLATALLPFRARLRIPLLLHLFVHARSQSRHAEQPPRSTAGDKAGRGFTLQAFKGLIDSLTGGIQKLQIGRGRSHWVDYYSEASHYSSEAIEHKKELVETFLAEAAPQTVWDMGANTGLFSRIAAARNIHTTSFEMDPASVEENYRLVRANREENLLPLVCDLTNPSPGIGWANEERMTIPDRGPADLVMALALVHHLAIANNLPLPKIAEYFARLGQRLIIEFVPKEDEKVEQLLASREDIFPGYTRDGFEEAFVPFFEIERREEIKASERVLYLMRKR